jgi:hypothetical protein
MRLWTIFAGLACLVVGPAAAQPPDRPDWRRDDDRRDYRRRDDWRRDDWRRDRRLSPQSDTRHLWAYSAGNIIGNFADQGNGRWVESNNTGQFFFRETGRTPDYVELFDDSRSILARLYDTQLFSRGTGETQWQPVYTGGWR